VQRAHAREQTTWRLTYGCSRDRIDSTLEALVSATGCDVLALRALES
jgi:hypothetical protein